MVDGSRASLDSLGTTVWGLDPNVAAALAYAVGWVSGVVLLVFEPNKFVRFHALQSTIVFGALSLAWMVALSVPFLGWIVAIFVIPPVSARALAAADVQGVSGRALQGPRRRRYGGAAGIVAFKSQSSQAPNPNETVQQTCGLVTLVKLRRRLSPNRPT